MLAFLALEISGLTSVNGVLDRIELPWYLIPIVITPLHFLLGMFSFMLSCAKETWAARASIIVSLTGFVLLMMYLVLAWVY